MSEGMRDRVHCTACDGTGRAPLGVDLQVTLEICRELAKREQPITAPAVASHFEANGSPTMVNNRLDALERHGLLRRSGRHGRRLVFELIKSAEAPLAPRAEHRLAHWTDAEMVHVGHLRELGMGDRAETPEGRAALWAINRILALTGTLRWARSSVSEAARRIDEMVVEGFR